MSTTDVVSTQTSVPSADLTEMRRNVSRYYMQCPTCLCEVLNQNGYASRGTASDDADDDAADADDAGDDVDWL